MSDKTQFHCPGDWCSDMMKPPELSQRFGDGAWVYSEIAARAMVVEAYEAGKKSVQGGQ